MHALAQLILFLVVVSDFAVLGMSRLSACIRAVAWQGLLLGVLVPVVNDSLSGHTVVLAAGTVLVKAVALPAFLRWATREAAVRREIEPLVGYMASLLLGVVALVVAFAVASVLPAGPAQAELLIPASLVTVM